MSVYEIGCKVQAALDGELVEGIVFSVDINRDCVALEKVVYVESGSQHRGLLNVQQSNVVKVIDRKKLVKKSRVSGKGVPQALPGIAQAENSEQENQQTADQSSECNSQLEASPISVHPNGQLYNHPDTTNCHMNGVINESLPKQDETASARTGDGRLNVLTYKVPSNGPMLCGGVNQPQKNDSSGSLRSLPVDYVVIDSLSDVFYRAISEILSKSCVGLALEGVNLGRRGTLCWIQTISVEIAGPVPKHVVKISPLSISTKANLCIATASYVFLFDILALGDNAFDEGLRRVLESEFVQKVIHDCRVVSDVLYHVYNVILKNIFDTQVADIMVYAATNRGHLPKEVSSLTVCLFEYISLSVEQVFVQTIRDKERLADENVWMQRPASSLMIEEAVKKVMYLLELRVRLIEKMLSDFTDGVDIYLGLHRDASSQRLVQLEMHGYMTPAEFLDLSLNAAQSRKRFHALYKRHCQTDEPQSLPSSDVQGNKSCREDDAMGRTEVPVGDDDEKSGPISDKYETTSRSSVLRGWPMDFSSGSNAHLDLPASKSSADRQQQTTMTSNSSDRNERVSSSSSLGRAIHGMNLSSNTGHSQYVYVAAGHEESLLKGEFAKHATSKKSMKRASAMNNALPVGGSSHGRGDGNNTAASCVADRRHGNQNRYGRSEQCGGGSSRIEASIESVYNSGSTSDGSESVESLGYSTRAAQQQQPPQSYSVIQEPRQILDPGEKPFERLHEVMEHYRAAASREGGGDSIVGAPAVGLTGNKRLSLSRGKPLQSSLGDPVKPGSQSS